MNTTLVQLDTIETCAAYHDSVKDELAKRFTTEQNNAIVEILNDFAETMIRSGIILLQAKTDLQAAAAPAPVRPAPVRPVTRPIAPAPVPIEEDADAEAVQDELESVDDFDEDDEDDEDEETEDVGIKPSVPAPTTAQPAAPKSFIERLRMKAVKAGK